MTMKDLERRLLTNALQPLRLLKTRSRGRMGKRGRRDDEPMNSDTQQAQDDQGNNDPDQASDNDDGPGTVTGYAAVFYDEADPGTEYKLWSDRNFEAVERIAPGAFSRACREADDCRALVNHDPNLLLGRTSSGTLRITEDQRGLRYDVDLPDTTIARDLAVSVERGDINGSSFGFVVESESWDETKNDDGTVSAVRTIRSVRLLDVGPVTYPAYSATSAGRSAQGDSPLPLGSVEEARSSYERWKATQGATGTRALPLGSADVQAEAEARARRIRLAEIEQEGLVA